MIAAVARIEHAECRRVDATAERGRGDCAALSADMMWLARDDDGDFDEALAQLKDEFRPK